MQDRKNGHNGHGDGNGNGASVHAAIAPALSAEQKEAIREQLGRVLASPLFSHSKRFPDFLRYTVDHALDRNTNGIKERTLGVEVFGREADYDTGVDPVVRMTAVEIRKRLAQYYQLPNHENEPRIEFARGSYVPEFRFVENGGSNHSGWAAASAQDEDPIAEVGHTEVGRQSFFKRWRWLAATCVVLPSLLISGFLLNGGFLVNGASRPVTEQFWAPVTASSSPVLICLPDLNSMAASAESGRAPGPASSPVITAIQQMPLRFRRSNVWFGDVMALTSITAFLGSKGKSFHLRHTEDVTLDDLKYGPVVLIGAYNNQWALELGDGLRFSFARDGEQPYIRDGQSPDSRAWATVKQSDGSVTEDYAIISRVLDRTTGHIALTAAGIHNYGTQAAGECIASAECLEKAERMAPGDWSTSDVQIVVGTSVIGENAGEPQVLAARVW